MGQVIKKVFMILLIIAAIFGAVLVAKRYEDLKDSGKLDKVFNNEKNSDDGEFGPLDYLEAKKDNNNNDSKNEMNEKKEESEEVVQENKKDDREFIVEEKDYEGYYNKFIFDNTILLYEGNQTGNATRELVDILIKNVDDPMYSKPIVELRNIGGLSANVVNESNFDLYKQVLNQFKKQLGNNTYEVLFEYAKFSSVVNKIIITKK